MQIKSIGRAFRKDGNYVFAVVVDNGHVFCVPSAEHQGQPEGGMYSLEKWVQSEINSGEPSFTPYEMEWIFDSESWVATRDINKVMLEAL